MDEIFVKLRAIKALLFYISEVESKVPDGEYALMFLSEQINECIEKLEEM